MKNELHKNKGYVLYIDVLGYKETVRSNNEDDIEALKEFLQNIQPSCLPIDKPLFDGCDKNKFYIRYFSDNILIFYQSIEEDLRVLLGMMYLSNLIQSTGIVAGFMTRGSLSYGSIEYNGRIVFGRHVIDSYELEEDNISPSVCLSPSLKEYIQNVNIKGLGTIMSPFGHFHNDDPKAMNDCLFGIMKMIDRLNLQTKVDETLVAKYNWLIEEYNRYFSFNPKKMIVRLPCAIYQIQNIK